MCNGYLVLVQFKLKVLSYADSIRFFIRVRIL